MEKHDADRITALLPQLIELIDCNVLLMSYLRATKTIGLADEHHLNSLTNKLAQSKALLDILFSRKDGYKFLVEGLRYTGQNGALAILNEPIHCEYTQNEIGVSLSQFEQTSAGNSNDSEIPPFVKIPFQTKEATELFTGRSNELNSLLEHLMLDGSTASITGMGGIGKTELAKMFLQKIDQMAYNIFKQVIWINCESSYSATTDFTNVAKDYLRVSVLGSSNQHRDISSILNDVYDKLEKSKSIIILDNVETKEMLQMFMRETCKKSKLSILITSQCLEVGKHIPLDSLDLREAVEFVKKGLKIIDPTSQELENGILQLVQRLEMFPLAISQAIGYIKERQKIHSNYDPHDYLADLDRVPERLIVQSRFDESSKGKTIYKTLSLALSKIEACESFGLLASKILSHVAFIAADNIPSSLFFELAGNNVDATEDALLLMRRFSIIKSTSVCKNSGVYFSTHRLVQDVLRIRIAQNNETENSIRSTMELLSSNLNNEIIDHALETWRHVTKHQCLVILFSSFPFKLALEMERMGRISDAYDFSTSALTLLSKNLNTNEHATTIFRLRAYNNYILGLRGRFDDSLEKIQITLSEAKRYLHVGSDLIFKIRYYTAYIYFESGANDKAALICDEMFEDANLYKSLSLFIFLDIGRLQNWLRRFHRAQKTATYLLEHLSLTSSDEREILEFETKGLIAHIHYRMGNYRECINLYNEIMQPFIQTQFEDRTSKISRHQLHLAFRRLGTSQYLAGFYDAAYDSYKKALNTMNGQTESDCFLILRTKSDIAALMLELNNIDEALSFSKDVFEQCKKNFGENNFWTLKSFGNIGVANTKLGRHHDAVKILTHVIQNENYVLRSDDEARFERYYLALSLEQIGGLEKSLEILNELNLKSLETPSYKLYTKEQVGSVLKRLHKTRIKKIVMWTVYKAIAISIFLYIFLKLDFKIEYLLSKKI